MSHPESSGATEKSKGVKSQTRPWRKGNCPHQTKVRDKQAEEIEENSPSDQRNETENWVPYLSIRLVTVRMKDSAQGWWEKQRNRHQFLEDRLPRHSSI